MTSYDGRSAFNAQEGDAWADEFVEERPEYEELVDAYMKFLHGLYTETEWYDGSVGDWVPSSVRARFASGLELAEKWAYSEPHYTLLAQPPSTHLRSLLDTLDELQLDYALSAEFLAALLIVAGHSIDVSNGQPFLHAFLMSIGARLKESPQDPVDIFRDKFKKRGDIVEASSLPVHDLWPKRSEVQQTLQSLGGLLELTWDRDAADVANSCAATVAGTEALDNLMARSHMDVVELAEVVFLLGAHLAATCCAHATGAVGWRYYLQEAARRKKYFGDWLVNGSQLYASVRPLDVIAKRSLSAGWILSDPVSECAVVETILRHEYVEEAVRTMCFFVAQRASRGPGLAHELADVSTSSRDGAKSVDVWADRLETWSHQLLSP